LPAAGVLRPPATARQIKPVPAELSPQPKGQSMKRILLIASAVLVSAACGSSPSPAPAAPAAAGGSFASSRITVSTRGTGPDIILVPGLGSDRAVWDQLASRLEGRYRLHIVQVNGFAGVPPGANAEGPVSAPVAEEIGRYITEQGLNRPAVVGHSMGGTIAMMLAARQPAVVGRLMVVDMTPFMGVMFGPPGSTAESLRPMADSMRNQMLAVPPGTPGMFEQMVPTMTRVDSMKPALAAAARASHQATVANAFHELILTDLRPELARITAPTTVLYVIPPTAPIPPAQYDSAMRGSYSSIPGVRIVKVEDSYHFIQFDQPDRLADEVDALMQRPLP
jgi:pimeloyl-ACP methyl ester carboxylesterase